MEIIVYKGNNTKIVKAIGEAFPKMSYAAIQKLLRKKEIKLNGLRVHENVAVKNGDEIYVYASLEVLNGIVIKPVIVFEDDNIIVCDKPVGLEVESDVYNDLTASVNGYLKSKNQKAVACHRIDSTVSRSFGYSYST